MARVKGKASQTKRSAFSKATLLVFFTLSKIGQVPILIIKFLIKLIKMPVKFMLPKYTVQLRIQKKFGISRRLSFLLSIIIIIIIFYTYFIFQLAQQLPSPTKLSSTSKPLTTEFFDRNGKVLYRLYEGRNRSLVKLNELPKNLVQATIAVEDKRFYKHGGFDPLAIIRAARQNKNGSFQGASTITQQLVKNTLLTPEQTYTRKLKEIFLSFWAERIYSKDEILQMYFNEAPYGGPAWGIEAASEVYFGKSAHDLDLAESAFLAGLPASPTQFSPFGTNPDLARERQKHVLARMVEDGYIRKEDAEKAQLEELNLKQPGIELHAPHFVMYVRDLLAQKYGPRVVSQGGLKVTTTLDLGLQEEVEQIVKEEVEKLASLNVQNGAAMVTDPKTGQILSMVGSREYNFARFGNFNTTLALRQPGSSIKVITYSTAFKQGFSPGTTILDTPVSFKDGINSYSPVNYDRTFHGPVSIRTALGSSYNVPAVKMLATIGLDNMIQTAKEMGITTFDEPSKYGLSLTLGGGDVRMIDMMTVYGTLSQLGERHDPTPILKVTDSAGNTLEDFQNQSKQVLQEEIAYLLTSILTDNKARTPAFGPNSLLNLSGHTVAVKTGTSDNKRDNWTFGYTPDFVVGVWVGNNDNSPMNPALTSGITGAAPIWNRIMKGILDGKEDMAFRKPAGIIEAKVDGRKDLAVSGILPKGLVRISRGEDQTTFFDAFSSFATSSAITSAKNGGTN